MSYGFIVIKDKDMIVCDNNLNVVPALMDVTDVPRIFPTWQLADEYILSRNKFEATVLGYKQLYEIREITEEMEADIILRRLRRPVNH